MRRKDQKMTAITLLPKPSLIFAAGSLPFAPNDKIVRKTVREFLEECEFGAEMESSSKPNCDLCFFPGLANHFIGLIGGKKHYGISDAAVDRIIEHVVDRDAYILQLLAYSMKDPLTREVVISQGRGNSWFEPNERTIEYDHRSWEVYKDIPGAFPESDSELNP